VQTPKKILIVRFSSIGDIVLTTPVIRCLKKQLPEVELHYLTKKSYGTLLSANPYLSNIHLLEEDWDRSISKLRAEGFDFIVDLHHNLRTLRLKKALGVPSKSFYKANFEKWLIVNAKIDRLPRTSIVDRYLKTVEHLGVKNDGQGLDYFIPKEEEINVKELLPNISFPFICMAIGGQHHTKKLPLSKLISIGNKINQPIVLLGGKEDAETGQALASSKDNIFDLCGRTSLHGSASILFQAARLITHDTGMMHIGAALKKPITSIWGNTIPDFGMSPYYPSDISLNTTIEVEGLSCRPCSKIGHATCPKGHFKCMKLIDEVAIIDSIRE